MTPLPGKPKATWPHSRLPADLVWVQERRGAVQDLPAKDDHNDMLTEMSPPGAPTAPTWTKRPTPKIAPLHRMQWAPRSSALFVSKDLGVARPELRIAPAESSINARRLLVTDAGPVGVRSAFKAQSSHFPGRAFIGPNPRKYPLILVSECVSQDQQANVGTTSTVCRLRPNPHQRRTFLSGHNLRLDERISFIELLRKALRGRRRPSSRNDLVHPSVP